MEEIFRYMFAGFGIGVLFTFGLVWFWIFGPEEKKYKELERKRGER